MSTVATSQYYASGCDRDAGRLCESGYKKRMKKKNGIELMFNFPLTKNSQQGKNVREKQYFQYWILRLVVFTRFCANKDCLLELYVNQISKNSFL